MRAVTRLWMTLLLPLALLLIPVSAASDRAIQPLPWQPSGKTISTLAVDGNTLYISGTFDYLGKRSGNGFAIVDPTTGRKFPDRLHERGVRALIADGTGGWFVGSSRNPASEDYGSVTRVNPDGSVAWRIATDGDVYALALSDTTLYVGGWFQHVGNQKRIGLAALDPLTGKILRWSPEVSGKVFAITLGAGQIFIGGSFTGVNNQFRSSLASFTAVTGELTGWIPLPRTAVSAAGQDLSGTVLALALDGKKLYVGGHFAVIAGVSRTNLAAFDLEDGALSGWDGGVNGPVSVLTVADGVVYAGSRWFFDPFDSHTPRPPFTQAGGQPRSALAAFDTRSSAVLPWNPPGINLTAQSTGNFVAGTELLAASDANGPSGGVYALQVSGDQVYIGGSFNYIGAPAHLNLAVFDRVTGNATDERFDTDGVVQALAISGGALAIGGFFTSSGGLSLPGFAALQLPSGAPGDLLLAPGSKLIFPAGTLVQQIVPADDRIFVSGIFAGPGGRSTPKIAAIDAGTGAALPWNPNITLDDSVAPVLAATETTVYIGGRISAAGGQPRYGLAAVDAATGAVLPFSPRLTREYSEAPWMPVRDMAVSGNTLYIVGDFTRVNGQSRAGLAAVDSSTGALRGWIPDFLGTAMRIVVDADTVYMSGIHWNKEKQVNEPVLIAFDAASAAIRWSIKGYGGTLAPLVFGGVVVTAMPDGTLAAFSTSTGTPTGWFTELRGGLRGLAIHDSMLYVAYNPDNSQRSELARLLACPGMRLDSTAGNADGTVEISGTACGVTGVTAQITTRPGDYQNPIVATVETSSTLNTLMSTVRGKLLGLKPNTAYYLRFTADTPAGPIYSFETRFNTYAERVWLPLVVQR